MSSSFEAQYTLLNCFERCIGKMQFRFNLIFLIDLSGNLNDCKYQVISPHDKGISNTIQSNLDPMPISSDIFTSDLCIDITQELLDKYFKYLKGISKPWCVQFYTFNLYAQIL